MNLSSSTNTHYTPEHIGRLQPFTLDCSVKVIYCITHEQVTRELKPLQKRWLSWDMEWNYNRATNSSGKVALIQLGDPKRILLIRTVGMSKLPPALVDILEDPDILKIGVNIRGDGKKVYDDFGVKSQGLLELSRVAHELDPEFWPKDNRRSFEKPISLQHLVARYRKRNLSKEQRVSNWEGVLTPAQQHYAACDADAYNQIFKCFIDMAADAPQPIDVFGLARCRVSYTDRDPFQTGTPMPLKATQSAPAVLSSAPAPTVQKAALDKLKGAEVPRGGSPSDALQLVVDDEQHTDTDDDKVIFGEDDDFELTDEMEQLLDKLEEEHALKKRAASAEGHSPPATQSPPKKVRVD